jgi:hypothetical protein
MLHSSELSLKAAGDCIHRHTYVALRPLEWNPKTSGDCIRRLAIGEAAGN